MKSATALIAVISALSVHLCTAEDMTTTDGTVYRNATVTKADPDALKISFEDGLARIPFEKLPEDIRQKYGYTPEAAAAFQKQVAEQRQAEVVRAKKAIDEASAKVDMKRKQALKNDEKQQLADTLTIKQIESDFLGNLDKPLTIQGTIEVDNYYGFGGFKGTEADFFSFRIRDKSGSGWVFMKRGQDANQLRTQIFANKRGAIEGRFTFLLPSNYYKSGEGYIFGLLTRVADAINVDE